MEETPREIQERWSDVDLEILLVKYCLGSGEGEGVIEEMYNVGGEKIRTD